MEFVKRVIGGSPFLIPDPCVYIVRIHVAKRDGMLELVGPRMPNEFSVKPNARDTPLGSISLEKKRLDWSRRPFVAREVKVSPSVLEDQIRPLSFTKSSFLETPARTVVQSRSTTPDRITSIRLFKEAVESGRISLPRAAPVTHPRVSDPYFCGCWNPHGCVHSVPPKDN